MVVGGIEPKLMPRAQCTLLIAQAKTFNNYQALCDPLRYYMYPCNTYSYSMDTINRIKLIFWGEAR